MFVNYRLAPWLAMTVLIQACASQTFAGQARLAEPALKEASGLATSRLSDSRLWLLNDGGHPSTLYALDNQGQPLAHLKVRGKRNRDWEDMASFSWRGRHWLMVADIGDNDAKHKKSYLYFIEEPELPNTFKKIKLKPELSIKFSYPDGPRDAEAIAFDPLSEQILILSKRERPAQLYALSLPALFAAPKQKHIATALGPLPWDGNTPGLTSLLLNPKRLISHGMATGFDISSDGLQAVVLGYQQAVLLRRNAKQSWAEASVIALPPHRLEQAEAIGFSRDGSAIYLTSEGKSSPLLKVLLP